MNSRIDYERLIMTGVLIVALILWGGIIAESVGLYPNGTTVAASVLGAFIVVFSAAVIALSYLTGRTGEEPNG
ncbi:hypothetical protein [Halorubrum trueperi]|uniref:Uncharacterized protein n=1 Tax=Halorubrum trueperi TaxID=2004704 RepID=A0ABD5ULG7_9EURY